MLTIFGEGVQVFGGGSSSFRRGEFKFSEGGVQVFGGGEFKFSEGGSSSFRRGEFKFSEGGVQVFGGGRLSSGVIASVTASANREGGGD